MSRNRFRVCWCYPLRHDCCRVTLWSGCATKSRSFPCSRARAQQKKNQEKDAQPEKIKRKIVFSDLRNPPQKFYAAVWRGRKI